MLSIQTLGYSYSLTGMSIVFFRLHYGGRDKLGDSASQVSLFTLIGVQYTLFCRTEHLLSSGGGSH